MQTTIEVPEEDRVEYGLYVFKVGCSTIDAICHDKNTAQDIKIVALNTANMVLATHMLMARGDLQQLYENKELTKNVFEELLRVIDNQINLLEHINSEIKNH